ncbi:MAG: STAS domain-containing protein [Magnetococcus sp. WYHC-3]
MVTNRHAFTLSQQPHLARLECWREPEFSDIAVLESLLREIPAGACVEVDLSRIAQLGGRGLGVFLMLRERNPTPHQRIRLVNSPRTLHKILLAVGFDRMFEIGTP